VAPAWQADGRLEYGGGFFWVNADGARSLPRSAFLMLGAGGQRTAIIPTHDLVVVRPGHFKGAMAGERALNRAFKLLMEAIPARR
jgi:CubicO group peptidase (beta-lactamase class C family)